MKLLKTLYLFMFSPIIAVMIAFISIFVFKDRLTKVISVFVFIISILNYIIGLFLFDLGIQLFNNFPLLYLLDLVSVLLIVFIVVSLKLKK